MALKKLFWLGLVIGATSCVQILDGAYEYGPLCEGADCVEVKPCNTDLDCDDKNPCTGEVCNETSKTCEWLVEVDGPASNGQVPSDCKTIFCVDGNPNEQEDAADVLNDGNPCTDDICTASGPSNTVSADGSTCIQGTKTGTCVSGVCEISCDVNNPCDDGNPCTDDFCNTATSQCIFTNLDGTPTPKFVQIDGDCKFHICLGGMDTEITDDADLPVDANSCTQDVCSAGNPSNPSIDPGTPCTPGDTQVCDGSGLCVECTVAEHCIFIVEDECTKRDCVANKCVPKYLGQETAASPALQTPGDCQQIVCNGMGGTAVIADDTDLPNDNNPCTKDLCANGMSSTVNEAANTPCGNGQVCNMNGVCVGCNTASACPGVDDFCITRTCVNNACGFSYTAAGTDLPVGQTVGDCKVLECDGMGKVITSVSTSDKPVDNKQCTQDVCNAMGVPSNPPTALNSPCSEGGNDACDGNGTCKKSQGKACGGAAECANGICADGYCCENVCTTTCKSCNVTGSLGLCVNVAKGIDDGVCSGMNVSCNGGQCDSEIGQPCTMSANCLSDICADGVCCSSSCTAACKSCNVPTMAGTCSNVPMGQTDNNPAGTCSGMNQCDGTGVCKRVLGAACTAANECLSGFCADGFCCNNSCAETCKSCGISGSLGTCINVPSGQTDPGTCSASGQTCDGTGACKKALGQTCAMAGECFSGFCADGVCCSNACTGPCSACTTAKTGGTQGTCAPVMVGTDPDNECATQPASTCATNGSCDGAGACQLYPVGTVCAAVSCSMGTQQNADTCNGMGMCVDSGTTSCAPFACGMTSCKTSCTADTDCLSAYFCDGAGSTCKSKKTDGNACLAANECLSGFCADGICCKTACTTTCQACDVAGSVGTCTNLPMYDQDNFPANTCSGTLACNGSGVCKKNDGEPCANNTECVSGFCGGIPKMCIPI